MQRGNVAATYGTDKFVALSEAEQAIVCGLHFGSCGWCPGNESDWDTLYRPDSRQRKDTALTAIALYLGRGGCEKDVARALKLWHIASTTFDPNAAYSLGVCALYGTGVEQSNAEAAKWFDKARNFGHCEAMYLLGQMYMEGRGVEEDPWKAADCWIKGSENKHYGCRRLLAGLYWQGVATSLATGVEQNFKTAIKLYKEAFEGGEKEAEQFLKVGFEKGLCLEGGAKLPEPKKPELDEVPYHHKYAIRLGPLTPPKDYGECSRCGKKLLEGKFDPESKRCEACIQLSRMLKSQTSALECCVCFTLEQAMFSPAQRDRANPICWACSDEPAPEKDKEKVSVALKNAGNDFFKRGKHALACRCYERAIAFWDEPLVYHVNLIAALSVSRRFRQVYVRGKKFLQDRDPENVQIKILVARACVQLGFFEEARQLFLKVFKSNPQADSDAALLQDVERIGVQMFSLMDAQKHIDAMSAYTRAPPAVKGTDILQFAAMDVLFRMERFDGALQEARKVLQLDMFEDYMAHALHVQAICELYTDTLPPLADLIAKVEQALNISTPKSLDRPAIAESLNLLQRLQSACVVPGDDVELTEVVAAANRLQALDEKFGKTERCATVCLRFAEACLKRGTNSGRVHAAELGRRAAKWASMTDVTLSLFERLGHACADAGEYDAAIAHFTLCMDLSFPPSETVLYARACAYQQKGMWREARADFAKLSELRPSNKAYKKAKESVRVPNKETPTQIPEFYVILGVSLNASQKEIKKAFKKLALATHPDKIEEEELKATTARFRAVSEAYLTLSDPLKRAAYDKANGVLEE